MFLVFVINSKVLFFKYKQMVFDIIADKRQQAEFEQIRSRRVYDIHRCFINTRCIASIYRIKPMYCYMIL